MKSVGWFFLEIQVQVEWERFSSLCWRRKLIHLWRASFWRDSYLKGLGIGIWRDLFISGLILHRISVFFALQATTPYMAWKFGWPDVCHPICSMSICQPPFLSLCLGWAFLFPLMWFLPESSFWSPYVWLSSTPSIT